jgi:hypothetical protein
MDGIAFQSVQVPSPDTFGPLVHQALIGLIYQN